ncbi:uncharacterized protein F4812DRAFT_422216 [Daldinia caldariorum]|uniref:uncharacterized protein n=1 Tax=Daldinia caldariorum TaxID=326644 RepID=UPI002007A27D|nr:uncharacterized protein F4812DRAFT_422216 [Daldinia caldariorum]KAI1469173.1 hypothetical protein F4812DRAFT_422216 [Daldinia caldariorum]
MTTESYPFKSLQQLKRLQPLLPQLLKHLQTLLPTYVEAKQIIHSCNQAFREHFVPKINTVQTDWKASTPAPDYAFEHHFISTANEMSPDLNIIEATFRCMNRSFLMCPYLFIEAKSFTGQVLGAENQAIMDGRIALDMTWGILEDQDMIFVVCTMPWYARISVMWREEKTTESISIGEGNSNACYHIKPIRAFSLDTLEGARMCRQFIYRIHYWATVNRLPRIQKGIDNWRAKGYPKDKHQISLRNAYVFDDEV